MSDNASAAVRAGKDAKGSKGVSRRRTAWMVAAAVAALVAIALVIWGLTAGSTSRTTAGATDGPSSTRTTPSTSPTSDASPSASTSTQPTATEPTEGDSQARPTNSPVDVSEPATPTDGITARLTAIESVAGEAAIPGEVGGPAVRVTLEVINDTGRTLETPAVVVNLYIGDDLVPAGGLLNPGGKPFPSLVSAGGSARGVYVFGLPLDQRDNVTIEVDLAVGTPVVLFKGALN